MEKLAKGCTNFVRCGELCECEKNNNFWPDDKAPGWFSKLEFGRGVLCNLI